MFKFKFSYVALATALCSTMVYAAPTTYDLRFGTQVVDIEAPNAAGVSHNMYSEFSVSDKGLVLNNSTTDLAHETLGNIAKNNNLTNGAASVILNEVISNKPSALNGFIEVTGAKADVIIANPNGISCSGCSFINTNKSILTTGTVNLTSTGAIASYTVDSGNITIDKNGMNANNSYAVLLGNSININGMVQAANANVIAGAHTFDNTTGKTTSAGNKANLIQMVIPEYSIDIGSLGGIKAGSISMIGNDIGLGVRNKGAIVANSTLAMSSNGQLINEGSITSNGLLSQMVSLADFKNTGTISTKNSTLLTSYSNLINEGDIISTKQLFVTAAGNVENKKQIKGTKGLSISGNNIKTAHNSALYSDAQITVAATGNVDNAGSMRAQNVAISFGGDSAKVSGDVMANSAVTVKSWKDSSYQSGAITNTGTISGDNVSLYTNGNIELASGSNTTGRSTLASNSYNFTNSGTTTASDMDVNSSYFKNYGAMSGDDVTVTAYKELLNEKTLSSTGDMLLTTQNGGNIINRSNISAGNTLTLTAKQVQNGGYRCNVFMTCGKGTLSANKLVLNSSHKYASNMGGTQNFKNTEINTVK